MAVCLGQRTWPSAVQYGRDTSVGIVAGICVKRYAVFSDRHAEECFAMTLQCLCQALGAWHVHEGDCQQDATDLDPDAAESGPCALNDAAQFRLRLLWVFLRDHAPVDSKGDAIGHNVGVYATLDEPDIDRG